MLSNLQNYNMVSEGESAIILAHFDRDLILNIVQDNIINKCSHNLIGLPNTVQSLEFGFNSEMANNPSIAEELRIARQSTYDTIIKIICEAHNLAIIPTADITDNYSVAWALFDFFVAKFKENLISFYAGVIINEKNNLYNALEMAALKRNKDSSTIYGKKSYNNVKIAVIQSNLESVIDYLFTYDIKFDDILNIVCDDKNIARHLSMIVESKGDMFREIFVRPFTVNNFANKINLINAIRLRIHYIMVESDKQSIMFSSQPQAEDESLEDNIE